MSNGVTGPLGINPLHFSAGCFLLLFLFVAYLLLPRGVRVQYFGAYPKRYAWSARSRGRRSGGNNHNNNKRGGGGGMSSVSSAGGGGGEGSIYGSGSAAGGSVITPQQHQQQPKELKLGKLHSVLLSHIMYVDIGKQTTALRRVENASVSEALCFSLLTKEGSLDLEANSPRERDALVQCFSLVLDEVHAQNWRDIYRGPSSDMPSSFDDGDGLAGMT
ncbi:hypothetical protein ACHAXM_001693 [Skeletonema potamos]